MSLKSQKKISSYITFSDIFSTENDISLNVINWRKDMKEHVKGGALTEVTLYILLALYQPNHGYGIMQFVEAETEGRLTLGTGTLYGALNTLVEKEWIKLYGEEGAKKKKNYIITELGKEKVLAELNRLKQVLEKGQAIVNGG